MDSTRQHIIGVFRKKLLCVIGKTVKNNTGYTDIDLVDLLSVELDKGIINYLINKNIYEFDIEMYLVRARMVMCNLVPTKYIDNPRLLTRLLEREITVQELCETMTHRDMFPEHYIKVDLELEYEFYRNYGIIDPDTLPDGALKCIKCKSWKTSYYEKQLRCSDEPSTIFANCHKCGKKWRMG
jgi:DNA-directed RNA polymerase subunit M/transcription elongation factor TFIIS